MRSEEEIVSLVNLIRSSGGMSYTRFSSPKRIKLVGFYEALLWVLKDGDTHETQSIQEGNKDNNRTSMRSR